MLCPSLCWPWLWPCPAHIGSAVPGNRIQLPLCLKCLLQRLRHCPSLPWQKWLTAMRHSSAHLSSTLSVPVIELGIQSYLEKWKLLSPFTSECSLLTGCDSAGKLAFPGLGWDCNSTIPSAYPPGASCLASSPVSHSEELKSLLTAHPSWKWQLKSWRGIRV